VVVETDPIVKLLADADIVPVRTEERVFPGEKWLVVYVAQEDLLAAQAMAGALEERLNQGAAGDSATLVVVFRPASVDQETSPLVPQRSRLAGKDVDQLIQLLEARSRTSDALPSLMYMEDPRASLGSVGASRHQIIYGRRGVGKTALLLEAKNAAEREGHAVAWVNAQVLRKLSASDASSAVVERILHAVLAQGGKSQSVQFSALRELLADLQGARSRGEDFLAKRAADINSALRLILREDLIRLYVYVDDFYLLDPALQPQVLDDVASVLRDCNGWLKIASIERLTRAYIPSTKTGLEVPHDATKIDLDVTLENPAATQRFLEAVLLSYTKAAGIRSLASISKPEALARLVLASGGVPRDYLNLFASSLGVARRQRERAKEVGREDVAIAAGLSARGKKRDLELDVVESSSQRLLAAIESLAGEVKAAGYAFFRVNADQRNSAAYETFSLVADLRFVHIVQASLSDQHKSGVRYEAYVLDLSEYSDIRLKRGLHVLDLEDGKWTLRLTGQARFKQTLTGELLRDQLRQSPIVDIDLLV
jgi:hypothetical protein